MARKVQVIDLSPSEFTAFSALEGEQAEQKFRAHRAANARRLKAGSDCRKGPACTTPVRGSLPSGPSTDWRIAALALVASAVILPVVFVGFIGLLGAIELGHWLRRDG